MRQHPGRRRTSEDARAHTQPRSHGLTSNQPCEFLCPNSRVIAFILLLLPSAALAQIPTRGNVFFGYSYGSADFSSNGRTNLNGWNGSLEGKVLALGWIRGRFQRPLWLAEYPCDPELQRRHQREYRGPRPACVRRRWENSLPLPMPCSELRTYTKARPAFPTSDTSFASALGGGIDYRLIHGIGWRVQADMLQTRFFSNTQNNFRLSTGIVLHF